MASEADLLKLHAQLESSASARGGGGLGFEKMSGKRKDGQTKASKLLQKQQKREFASTTAGAIAAGHWDPWARPVEFKMKAANTRAGGLYSMFVQGGTMGGTIKDVPNKAKKKDDKKDLRKDIQAAGDAGENSPVNFKWKHHIKATLQQVARELNESELHLSVTSKCIHKA
uniref:Uncharacterized protein n=1 Tax=Chrysotila carterae TaxID=13221 RepID=A0A7S4ET33_CHRCT